MVIALALLAAWAIWWPAIRTTPPVESTPPNPGASSDRALSSAPLAMSDPRAALHPEPAAITIASPTVSEEPAEERVAELLWLAMNDDEQSRRAILGELENRNPTIRRGAVEAVIQLGDRSLTNLLWELAGRAEDSEDRALFSQAAEFLGLPSLNEHLGLGRTNAGVPMRLSNSPQGRPGWPRRTVPEVRSRQPVSDLRD